MVIVTNIGIYGIIIFHYIKITVVHIIIIVYILQVTTVYLLKSRLKNSRENCLSAKGAQNINLKINM